MVGLARLTGSEATVYPDSSFLVSLVSQDTGSEAAKLFAKQAAEAMCYTPLHRIEVRNALRNAVGRKAISRAEQRVAFRHLEDDIQDGLLLHTPVNWTEAFRRADELSEEHAATDGQRTIDLLHVAIALESGAKTFLSFDKRQRKLAKAAGLKVRP